MAVVGFNYSKILAQRSKPVKGKVNVNSNMAVTDVKETKIAFTKDQKGLEIDFKYGTVYEPDVANIEIEGTIVYLNKEKEVKDLMKEWKKNKMLPREVMTEVLNYVLNKCNVEAIVLSRDINIPSPIPLPKVSGETSKD